MAEDKGIQSKIGFKDMEEFLDAYEIKKIRSSFVDKITTIIFVALGLVTALAWEEALRSIFEYLFGHVDTVGEKTLYALIITLITVIISVYFGKYFINKKK